MSAKYALMLSLAATLLAPSRGFAATTAAAPLPPQPVLRADEGDDEGEHKKEDDAAEKAKKKDPSDVRNAIGNLSLVRDMAKLAKPKKDGLWEQLVDQPYFTDEVRARKLLFHGQYDRAETEFAGLLKRDPKNPEYLQGQLEAILRQGKQANVKRFEEQLAALPKELQDSAKVVHLRMENMLEKGQVSEARALLKGFVDNHTKLLPADGDVLSVYNQYGEVLEQEAQYSSAVVTYQKVVDLAKENLPDDSLINTQIAMAVHRVSVLTGKGKAMHRTVLAMLDAVVNKDKAYWPAYLLQAQILMESHNTKEGGEAINETLGLNPNNLDARYLALEFEVESYQFEAARQQLAEIRERSDSAEVIAMEGRLLLKERVPEKALAPLLQSIAKNPRLAQARGWLASAYYLLNEKPKMQEQLEVIKTPDGSLHPVAVFEAAEILRDARQFATAEKLYQQAQEMAVWWSEPPAALAQLYLETGQEDKAKAAYDKSFAIDPYNMRAYNQLILLEYLQKFQQKESRARLKAGSTEPAFIFKYEKQDEVLTTLAVDWMEKIRPEIWSYFQIDELPAPTQIEFFPSHEQFGVRTTGLPWIGTVGACTGNVIAMDVPRGGAKDMMGSFDWARVLRHEYTHTVTLAMTNNRIPHWLTEAAACNQEQAPRDWDDAQLLVYNFRAGTLFKIQDLNWGFIRPKKPTDRHLAYMQSQWLYEYLVAQYGLPKMIDFMHCFRDGDVESRAWPKTYGKTMEEMDKEFLVWAAKQVEDWGFPTTPLPKKEEVDAALKTNPKDVDALYKLGWILINTGKAKEGRAQLEKALEIDPKNLKARELLGVVLNQAKEKEKARAMLEGVIKDDPNRPLAFRVLGLLAMADKDYTTAEKWFLKLQELRPLDNTSYSNLAGIYLLRKDNQKAIGQLSEMQRHEQRDERIPRKLASLFQAEGQLAEAESSAYRAIRINPYNAINHQLMGQIEMARGNPAQAVAYFRDAANLQPRVPEFWEELAEAAGQSGDADGASAAAKKAVDLAPTSPAKKWIK